jgi:predicted permease
MRRFLKLPRGKARVERDLDAELAFHLSMRIADLRARGLSESDARTEALRQFGDMAEARDYCAGVDRQGEQRTRRLAWLEDLRTDLAIGWRQIVRHRAFSIASIGTLTVAIGVTTAVFGVVHAYLIQPLPYPEPERLYHVIAGPSRDRFPNPPSLREVNWEPAKAEFAGSVAWDLDGFTLAGGERPEYADGAWVSPDYFSSLGLSPGSGRAFLPGEYRPGASPVAIISDGLWSRRYNRDPGVVGSTLRLYSTDRPTERELVTIVGVMPAGAWHVSRFTDVLRPLSTNRIPSIVKLRPGTSADDAARRLTSIVLAQIGTADPAWHMSLASLQDEYTHRVRPTLIALMGAALFMMLIAGASVAGSFVVRATVRRGELVVRSALGASRLRLVRQLFTESALLVVVASAGGAGLAAALVSAIGPNLGTWLGASIPADGIGGGGVLALAVVASASIAFLFGVLPLALVIRGPAAGAVPRDARGAASTAPGIRRTLIATQVAFTVVLLTGSALMLRSVWALNNSSLGFTPEGVVRGDLLLPVSRYPDSLARLAVSDRIIAELESQRFDAALANPAAFSAGHQGAIATEDREVDPLSATRASAFRVSRGYFRALQIPLLSGRLFDATDIQGAPPVALLSDRLARQLFPGQQALGRRIRLENSDVWATVVGITGDTRKPVSAEQLPDVYVALEQNPRAYVTVLARTAGDASRALAAVQAAVGRVDDVLALADVAPLTDVVTRDRARHDVLATLLTAFAVFALALAAFGLHTSISYSIAVRQRELAVRMAIGASPPAVVRLVMTEGARMIAVGLAVGVGLSGALASVLTTRIDGVGGLDLTTALGISLVMVIAAATALMAPARRATRVDPAIVLRGD